MLRSFFTALFSNKPRLAIIASLFTVVVLGMGPVFVRLSEVGPIATAFYRFFLSFPFLIIWMVVEGRQGIAPKTPTGRKDYFLILGAGVFLALDLTFWHMSIMYTTLVNATLINNLATIFVAIVSWFFLHEKIQMPLIVGIILAFLGSAILAGHTLSLGGERILGDIYALISAFFFAAFILAMKRLRSQFSPSTIMVWGAVPAICILLFIAYVCGERLVPTTLAGWMPLLVLALFVHVVGQGLMTYAMAYISATLSALLMSLTTVFAAFFAWSFFDENLTLWQLLGAMVAFIGVLVARLPGSEPIQKKGKRHA